MAITVRVQNFQSIKDATLVIDGLTAITGPNNSGKSAFMRAIRGVFQNTRGTNFVRHGAPYCQVDVALADGRTITWKKGPKVKPTYILNGGKPIHPGAAVPEEVREFGVVPITAGGRDVWPQIAAQLKGQVFLLNEPGSVLAEAVANVDRVGRLNRSLKASEKEKRSATSELKVRFKDRDRLQESLTSFEGLDVVAHETAALEEMSAKTWRIGRAITGLTDLQVRYKSAIGTVGSLHGVDAVVVPPTAEPVDILDSLEEQETFLDLVTRVRGQVRLYEGVESVATPEASHIRDQLDLLEGEEALRDRLDRAQKMVRLYEGVEKVELDLQTDWPTKLNKALDSLEDLKARLEDSSDLITTYDALVEQKTGLLTAAEEEVISLLGELGECPVCGTVCHSSDHKE